MILCGLLTYSIAGCNFKKTFAKNVKMVLYEIVL